MFATPKKHVPFAFPVRDSSNMPVSGSKFALMDSFGNILSQAASSATGVVSFLLKTSSRYLMRQTSAPLGMAMDMSCYAIVVAKDGRVITALPDGRFEILNTLALVSTPPAFRSQIYEKEAYVRGIGRDGAYIRLRVEKRNGSFETYFAVPKYGKWEARLNDALKAGETLTCTQTEKGAEESEAATMEVKSEPEAKNYLVLLK